MNLLKKSTLLLSKRHTNTGKCFSSISNIIKEDESNNNTITDLTLDEETFVKYKYGKDVSMLRPEDRRRLNGNFKQYDKPMHRIHYTVDYQRKMFARDGFQSYVDPGICWMDKNALDEALEKERLLEDVPIRVTIDNIAKRKAEEKEAIIQREKEVTANLLKLEKWKEDLQNKIQKKLEDARKAKEKKERLVEEVRRHFGFKIDPKDERFQMMLEQKEKQQKKEEKQAKKAAKEAQLIAKLQQMNADATSKS